MPSSSLTAGTTRAFASWMVELLLVVVAEVAVITFTLTHPAFRQFVTETVLFTAPLALWKVGNTMEWFKTYKSPRKGD